jgi:hypothetical protein
MITSSRPSSPTRSSALSVAPFTALLTLAMLLAGARPSAAQTQANPTSAWEFRATSGGLVATGAQRHAVKDAQVSWLVQPSLALTGTFGWARSRDLLTADDPKLDVFSYDLGAEARASEWFAGNAVTLTPFAGGGFGARSYNYRNLDVDATHNIAAYGTVGGELGMRRVGIRLEVRDYVTGFKPLAGRGASDTRNDVVIMVGLRFKKGLATRAP